MKTMFIEVRSNKDIKPILEQDKTLDNYKKIAIVATIQFLNQLNQAKTVLESKGKQIIMPPESKHTVCHGQILGCDPFAAVSIDDQVDAFLYIGTGEFHQIPLAVHTSKPIFQLNPASDKIAEFTDRKRWQNKLAARVSKVKDAKVIGLLISTKPGQYNLPDLKSLEDKEVFLFIGDTFSPTDLNNFTEIQAWVNTACPRIADSTEFDRPICNLSELR